MATVRPFARIALFLTVASMGALLADGAAAQARDIGKYEFDTYCALCHGKDAKGGGPFSGLVNKKVPDLTVLSKNNGGVFPFEMAYETISGAKETAAHGTREIEVCAFVYLNLLDAWNLEFDRILDGDDAVVFLLEKLQASIE